MQQAIGWILFAGISYLAWRIYRGMRKGYRNAVAVRQEAFSNAVSEAVASGVAQALSAAVADATASASGGSVNVHLGDNLTRLIANNYDDRVRLHSNEHVNNIDGAGNGSVQGPARHGELEGGRAIRRMPLDSASGGSIRVKPIQEKP